MEFGIAVVRRAVVVIVVSVFRLSLLIELREDRLNFVRKFFGCGLHLIHIVGFEFGLCSFNRFFNLCFIFVGELIACFFNGLFYREDKSVELVMNVDDFFLLLVFRFVSLSVVNSFINVFF